jgi:DNA replication protein DnaC
MAGSAGAASTTYEDGDGNLDASVFEDTPVDEGQIRELAGGDFIEAKRNLILIGGTGTGKTHLAIAIAAAVIRARARGRFFNGSGGNRLDTA